MDKDTQLADEGFVNVQDCPGCALLRSNLKRLRARFAKRWEVAEAKFKTLEAAAEAAAQQEG